MHFRWKAERESSICRGAIFATRMGVCRLSAGSRSALRSQRGLCAAGFRPTVLVSSVRPYWAMEGRHRFGLEARQFSALDTRMLDATGGPLFFPV
jgi:hypothetical protein